MFAQQSTTQSSGTTDFLSMWNDMMFKLVNAGWSFSPDAAPPEAFRQVRSAMLDTWADFWQRWMRAPEFLQLLKQAMDMNFQVRRQASDFWGQLRQESQGTNRQDIDQLMRALRHIEHRLADATERISRRMDNLEDRLAGDEEPADGETRRPRRADGRRRRQGRL